jgi:hypothetical protein
VYHSLHDFPVKHYKYLPRFDGDKPSAEKHIQDFEHFIDLFEIEHVDVYMRIFSQSLQGDAKEWFRHLQPESISSWEEMKDLFLKFWGERKPLDQLLSEFYSMKKQGNETVSMFNRRFHSFYHKMPKGIQPTEVVSMLYYAIALHPDLSLLLMERKYVSLQQMFNDAQEVEDNNVDVFAEDYIPPIEEEVVGPNCFVADLNFDPFHHEQRVDYTMNFFKIFSEECHESESVDQNEEEQVIVPIFMFDDIAEFYDLPKYDEYDDDYDLDSLEQLVACSPLGNDYVQQSMKKSACILQL